METVTHIILGDLAAFAIGFAIFGIIIMWLAGRR